MGCSGHTPGVQDAATHDAGSPTVEAGGADGTTEDARPTSEASVQDVVVSSDGGTDASADGAADARTDAVMDGGCPTDGGVPNDLACTGLYGDWPSKTIAADVTAYTPAFVLWSDGAQKSRWFYLPAGTQIDTSDMDDWVFPVGTKFWKEFVVGGQTIETRLISKGVSQWNLLDYRWSSDGTSATLLTTGETNVNGTTYEIPSTTECYTCHAGRTDMVLGFDLIGLGTSGAQGVTLADLAGQGRLTQPPPATTITIPEDSTGNAAAALGYMHVNCGVTCHNTNMYADALVTGYFTKLLAAQLYPDGGTGHVTQLDPYTTAVNVPATVMPGQMQYLRILPGDAAQSLVPLMALARDPDAGNFIPMPPIVSHQPDTTGVAAIQAWINAL